MPLMEYVEFVLHGQKHTVRLADISPETTLLQYLRDYEHLNGTKYMCLEGGCGACIVAVTATHPITKRIVTFAVNSCLVSIYSCKGWEIHTVNGIGNKEIGYHPIQKTLANFNGTQCGFCSPGMVMNMYPLYESNATMQEVEESFGGNMCRCTGYRPILTAFKSLAADANPKILGEYPDIEDIGKCVATGRNCPWQSRCENKNASARHCSIMESKWFKVYSVNEIFDVFRSNPKSTYQLVAGNTARGVYHPSTNPDLYIDVTSVTSLLGHSLTNENLTVGANTTLNDTIKLFQNVAKENDGFAYLQKIANHIKLVAHVPVRNIGTIAGNLSIKYEHNDFPSDIFLIFEAVGAKVTIFKSKGQETVLDLLSYLSYNMKRKVIKNVILPGLDSAYKYGSYKIMQRAQNSHAMVNAAFLLKLNNRGKVQSARIVYGGINPSFVHASKAEQYLIGKTLFDNKTLQGTFSALNDDIQPDNVLPQPSPVFRKNLAISLFYKFILNIAPTDTISPENRSGGQMLTRPISTGVQDFQSNKSLYPLTEPVNKLEAIGQTAELKNDWLKAIGRHHAHKLRSNYRICSEHFPAEVFHFIGDKKFLKKDSIPSLKIPPQEYVQFDFTKPLSMRIHNTCDSLPSTSSRENSDIQGTVLISDTPLSTTATSQPNQAISEHQSAEHKRKLPVSSSSDSEGLIGSPKRRRKHLRTFHNYCLSPRKMKVKLETRQVVCKSIAKKLKVSKERAERLSVKVKSLKDVLRVLEKKKAVSEESLMILDKTISGIPAALMRRLVGNLKRGKTSRERFPPELRSFAMTLQFYSSKAYNYVRKIFQLALPSPTVIRNWLSNIDCSPGFIQPALDTLKSKVKDDEKNNIKTICSLMLDEMSLKKQIDFVGNKTWGYVDIGTGIEDDELKSATEALVLMVVSLTSNWKIPIAYFLINGLSGKEKANLIIQALIIFAEINIEIVSITCDGPSAHFTMASELGAKMNISTKSGIQPYFLHPSSGSKVFIIFDACHMLKLMRNNWARLNKIYDRNGNEIDFGFITKLNEIQESLQFRLGNKLRKAHVDWTKQKMKVNLAAQTLSSSVADAIEFLCEDIGHEDFQNAEGTIKFIRTVDMLFDISNSRNVFAKGYKAPLRPSDDLFWSNNITEGIEYLKGLKNAAGTSLYLTKNKTPIKGLIITLTSIMGIYDEYMKPGSSLKYLLTYKLSQDHLELFFHNVRKRNGTNNNPTAFQFNNTFKRLMLHHDLKEGSGNCLSQDDTSILTVTSKREVEYITDIPDCYDQLYAYFVTANTPACTTVNKIDPSDALKLPGVVAFYDKNDIPGSNTFIPLNANYPVGFIPAPLRIVPEEAFCNGTVQYYFQPLGIVVAESQELAEKGASLVKVTYGAQKQKPLLTIRQILKSGTTDRIFNEASMTRTRKGSDIKHVVKGTYDTSWQYHYHMETQICVVIPKENNLNIYPGTQWMDIIQTAVANFLNIPENKINIKVRRLGGAFGGKITRNALVACATALAAYKLNKPVRMRMTFSTNMDVIGKRFPSAADYEVGLNENGEIQYLDNTFYLDYATGGNEAIISKTIGIFSSSYQHDTWTVIGNFTKTDSHAGVWVRAPGHNNILAMIETIMEHIAMELNKPPLEIRLSNMDPVQNKKLIQFIDELRQWANYDNRLKEVEQFNKVNRWMKKGLSLVPMTYPFAYAGNLSSTVAIYAGDGTVAVTHGGIEIGQGINTKVAQVCAYALNISLDMVNVKSSNNIASANNFATGGSLTSEAVCYATLRACEILLDRINPVRAKMKNATWQEIIKECQQEYVELIASHMYSPNDPPQSYDIYGVCATEVVVDILTGLHQITRVDLLEDTGNSMSPCIDIGQVEGAFVMGLGFWLTEVPVYDEEGKILTDRTWNYKIPGALDIPIDFRVKFPKNNPNPKGVLHSKATAEPPLCLSCSAPIAIREAVASARTAANSSAPKWYPINGPSSVENTFLNSLNDYQQYML